MMVVPVKKRAIRADFATVGSKFEADFHDIPMKMHRFPGSLRGMGERYIVPMAVAIGPYHHGLDHLQEMEMMKQVATHHFIAGSQYTAEQMYVAVLAIASSARRLYAHDVVSSIGEDEFAAMMFQDGCFLLQYMIMRSLRNLNATHEDVNYHGRSLQICFNSNATCIRNDIMLLENQLPMVVLQTLMKMRPVPICEFVAQLVGLQIRLNLRAAAPTMDGIPHLLGLVRPYVIGGGGGGKRRNNDDNVMNGLPSFSTFLSAIELAEIGIKLTPSEIAGLADMGVKEGLLFGKLCLAPQYLNNMKVSWLVNMAAFEQCTVLSFWRDGNGIVVCSYLILLAMLLDREESVQQLRLRGILYGPLSNRDALRFFKHLVMHLYGGVHYIHVLEDVENYKRKRWARVMAHRFVYRNWKVNCHRDVHRWCCCWHLQGSLASLSRDNIIITAPIKKIP